MSFSYISLVWRDYFRVEESFCDFPGRFGKWLDFQFDGHRISVPSAYKELGVGPSHGGEIDGIIFYARTENFGNLEPPSFYRNNLIDGKIILPDYAFIMLHKTSPPPQKFAEVSANLGVGIGVSKFKPLRQFEKRAGPFGLTQILYTPSHPYFSETFVSEKQGKIETAISCNIEMSRKEVPDWKKGENPGCEINTLIQGMNVNMNFNRTNLPRWDYLVNRLASFLDCGMKRALKLSQK